MEETDQLLRFLKEPNIFDLDLIDNGLIAGTRIETFYEIANMFYEICELDTRNDEDYVVTEEDVNHLFDRYPLLEFTNRDPVPGEPFSEISKRMATWSTARSQLGIPVSEREKEATEGFSQFMLEYELRGTFVDFLACQPMAETQEAILLVLHALDDLWAMTQRLKVRPLLTQAQEADRQNLERYVASQVKLSLVDFEHEKITHDTERRAAIRIVEERIAEGDWQELGPHRFKFNELTF